MVKSKTEEIRLHFVYAGDYYLYRKGNLVRILRLGMKKYNIRSITLTRIQMWRDKLITKEKMEKYFFGKERDNKTANDDIELLVENLQHGEVNDTAPVGTCFIPKLTTEELKLVEQKDSNYMQTFFSNKADVKEAEMKMSESDAKFVLGQFRRQTFTIQSKPSEIKTFYNFSDIELTANSV